MKSKQLFLVCFICLGLNYTQAQVSIGGILGANISNVDYDGVDILIPESRLGYFVGGVLKFDLTHRISVFGEMQYSLKGNKTVAGNNLPETEYKYGYFDLIPGLEFNLFKGLHLGAGVNFGIRVNEFQKIANGDWIDTSEIGIVSGTDYGLSTHLKLYHNKFFVFIRYNFSLKDVSDLTYTDINGNPIGTLDQYNRNTQLGFGYLIGFTGD